MTFPAERLRDLARRPLLLLAIVLAVGAALRLAGLDWDDGAHLHPDERYVTMVADSVDLPRSPGEYLDVETSPLSPYNTDNGRGYLYGQLPLSVTKLVAAAVGRDAYDGVQLVGRALSGLVDTLSILLVFLVARVVLDGQAARVRELGAVLAAAFYALAVTAIQHAHFFTMESWLVAATLGTFWLAARLLHREASSGLPLLALARIGAATGVTAAAKLSGLLVAVPVAIAVTAFVLRRATSRARAAGELAASSLLVLVAAYVTFRLLSPYAFEHSSWLDVRPNHDFRAALEAQQRALDGDFLYPPAYQWLLSERWSGPLRNLVVWGLGVPLGLAALAGLGALAYSLAAGRLSTLRSTRGITRIMLLAFVLVTFAQFASRFAHSIRYLLPLVPFLCVGAAYGIIVLHARNGPLARLAAGGVVAATLLYALAFTAVYRSPNTRVEASAWIQRNVEPGSRILGEHWDDGLPVGGSGGRFEHAELPVFDPDDEAKLEKLYAGLADADLYVLSSPRAWNTIGRLPDRFPIMSRFYDRLRDGELGFVKVAQFESPPRLLGLELADLDAEEPFWVYDHPPVVVFRRSASFDWEQFRNRLCAEGPLPGCT